MFRENKAKVEHNYFIDKLIGFLVVSNAMGSYKIKDLSSLTGIKSHTIRIWEKRYGLLQPKRTASKIRSYSDEDLIHLLNVAILYNKGWKISKISSLSSTEINTIIREEIATDVDSVISLLTKALVDLDTLLFDEICTNAIQREGLEITYTNYFLPFLDRIGTLWQVGTITPLQEHFASCIIRQKIITSTNQLPLVKKRKIDAVLFTPEGEWHEMSLLYYQFILRKRGYRTVYLGANLPFKGLEDVLHSLEPKNLVLSMITGKSKTTYDEYIQSLTNVAQRPIFIGGALADRWGISDYELVFPIRDLV